VSGASDRRAAAPATVLIPSPFLGAWSWRGVGRSLAAAGRATRVLDIASAFDREAGFYDAVADLAAGQIQPGATLVGHSGAGALMPVIAARAEGRVRRAIFVDALRPHPGRSWFDTVPEAWARRLRTEATGRLAPPWGDWWPREVMEALLPSPDDRADMARAAPRVPIAFLEERAPKSGGFDRVSAAFLQLSDAYAPEARDAEALGWPVARLNGTHLSIVTEPDRVATALIALL
jgi:pimeloyl-ACP methyl ester carboxylesterase